MSQKFDIVPDEPTDIPAPPTENNPSKGISVFEKGQSSNIDFEFVDGKRQFLRMAHLLHGELHKLGSSEEIKLLFSTHTVLIKGYCLKDIYEAILADNVTSISENDERYMNMVADESPFVIKIDILGRQDDGHAE